MINRIKELPVADNARRMLESAQRWLTPALLRRRTFSLAAFTIVLATIYWGFIASDRYISEAKVVIERTDMASGVATDIGALLTGGGGGNRLDQMLLRSHLLSVDMLNKLDKKLDLRGHYSDSSHDPLSRMWKKDAPQEWFHRYYLSRTSIEFDDYSGVLVINVQAYDPKMANAIANTLVLEGERFMNELGHAMARDQVAFLEGQVSAMALKAMEKRQELLAFQNQKGILAPQSAAEALQTNIYRMDSQLTDLKARRSVLQSYLSPEAPSVTEIEGQIRAIEKQIEQEQSRLTSPKGQTLNSTVEQYQRMELSAKFAEDIYKSALIALEKGRIEAIRTLKKVAVLQAPTLPQYPWEPRRIYNIVVFILSALVIAGIIHLLAAVVRDHQD